MTSKEALAFISKKAIQYIQTSYPVFDEEEFENYDKSQKVLGVLIERDTPMKPEFTNEYAYNFRCSKCESVIILSEYKKVNFCVKCGQRLDWSNE